jgi:histidinol-phosphate aminotransferase
MSKNIETIIRKNITRISPYVPGKPISELKRTYGLEKIIKLASNESPYGPSAEVVETIKKNAGIIHRYPDGSGYYLKNKLADDFNLSAENFILGNGSSEIISMALQIVLNPGDEIIYPHPSFLIFKILAHTLGAEPVEVELNGDYSYNPDKIMESISPRTKAIILCNPNNPTGTIMTKEQVEKLMAKIPDNILIISDEAYFEYVEDKNFGSAFPYIRNKNLLISRTFSKIYGLAALRIGYGIASKEITGYMERIRPPFNTTLMAQEAALTALKDKEYIEKIRGKNLEEKERLYQEFKKLEIAYIPSETNFILCKFKKPTTGLIKKLEKRGIIVRGMAAFRLPEEYMRITIGTREENDILLRNLVELM